MGKVKNLDDVLPLDDDPLPKDEVDALCSDRAKTRGGCVGVYRPCPHISCSHNLYLNVNEETGAVSLNNAGVDVLAVDPDKSCALDIADAGEHSLEEIQAAMPSLSIGVVERIEQVALRRLRPYLKEV
ncbi:MAG: RNA polymerase sigma factor [Candidatus Peregrinibacteria bacterium GW2011_GWC2_39_14]|nr:MAG: RNA polymerase sigma factor [Candidatus Peregrinibacteria bacterium GW2011_GWC2_39_14]